MPTPRRPALLARLLCLGALIAPLSAPAGAPSNAAISVGRPTGESGPMLRGRLANGLRYVILPRRAGQPGVGLFMKVEGGFLAERRPGERGLAHLIEHLVFHSPTRSAPNDLRRFRSVGMPLTFPEPAGATTTWRDSDYFLVARTAKLQDLDALLGLYREVASELTFRADAVDEQRAQVMREMADKRLGNLISARYVAAVAPGSPNDLIDAQNSDDVPTAAIETIRGLYDRLYRPENTSVVIVGDVDPRQVEAIVRKRFAGWRGKGPRSGRAAIPNFRPDRIAPISHSALAEARSTAMITVASPLPPPERSRRRQAESTLMDMVAMSAVNERLALTQAPGRPGKFGIFIENGEQGRHRLIMLWDDFEPGRWRPAVAGLARTACRLSTAGLTEQEWTKAKQRVLQDLERRAKDIPNIELARHLSNELAAGRHLIPPDEMLLHVRARLPALDSKVMNAWWRRQWSAGVRHLRVEAPDLAGLEDPAAAIGKAAADSVRSSGCMRPDSGRARLTSSG